jgi:hypothetical protein
VADHDSSCAVAAQLPAVLRLAGPDTLGPARAAHSAAGPGRSTESPLQHPGFQPRGFPEFKLRPPRPGPGRAAVTATSLSSSAQPDNLALETGLAGDSALPVTRRAAGRTVAGAESHSCLYFITIMKDWQTWWKVFFFILVLLCIFRVMHIFLHNTIHSILQEKLYCHLEGICLHLETYPPGINVYIHV